MFLTDLLIRITYTERRKSINENNQKIRFDFGRMHSRQKEPTQILLIRWLCQKRDKGLLLPKRQRRISPTYVGEKKRAQTIELQRKVI